VPPGERRLGVDDRYVQAGQGEDLGDAAAHVAGTDDGDPLDLPGRLSLLGLLGLLALLGHAGTILLAGRDGGVKRGFVLGNGRRGLSLPRG